MKSGAGGTFRDGDFFEFWIVGLEKAFALTVHADPAWNQVRLTGLDVTIALDAGEAAGPFQFAQDALQFLLSLRRQMEGAEQFGNVQRHVIALGNDAQKFRFEVFHVMRELCADPMVQGRSNSEGVEKVARGVKRFRNQAARSELKVCPQFALKLRWDRPHRSRNLASSKSTLT